MYIPAKCDTLTSTSRTIVHGVSSVEAVFGREGRDLSKKDV